MINKYLQKGYATFDFNKVPRGLHVYWLRKDVSNEILRVGITKNPYLMAAKIPDDTHLILFKVECQEEAEILVNSMICDISPRAPRRLLNVYTLGQAKYRLRKVWKNFDLEYIIQSHNEASGVNQKIFTYKGKKWISKNVIDDYISMSEFLNNYLNNYDYERK